MQATELSLKNVLTSDIIIHGIDPTPNEQDTLKTLIQKPSCSINQNRNRRKIKGNKKGGKEKGLINQVV